MFDFFEDKCNGGVKVDLQNSVYCGDAAGRPKDWKPGKKKDFSCVDRAFANNIRILFKTPEEYFLKESAAKFEWDSIDPHSIVKKASTSSSSINPKDFVSSSQEVVLLVGVPASGKSTFAKTYFVCEGYERINRDTLKTKEKCIKMAQKAL